MGHNQNLLRIDYEDVTDLDKIHSDLLFEMITKSIQSDFIILSDYAKGTLSPELICNLIKWAIDTDKKIVVDPKPAHKEYYKNCYLITPNKKEAQEMTGIILNGKENLSACGNKLMQELNCLVVITLGEEGMAVFDNNADIRLIPTRAREVFDVSGAGDTATAALTLGLSSGASLWQAAEIANIAAGIKVSKIGTHPVSLEEIMQFILDNA